MLKPIYSSRFTREFKKFVKSGRVDVGKFTEVSDLLLAGRPLLLKHRNHKLHGEFIDHWECHIAPDWLLIYRKTETHIYFVRIGSHSDLF